MANRENERSSTEKRELIVARKGGKKRDEGNVVIWDLGKKMSQLSYLITRGSKLLAVSNNNGATAATSYALALADIAKSNDTLNATTTDIEEIDKIISYLQVFHFFANPTVDGERKKEVLKVEDI
ncbi:hypothetical protein AHAS_Ahas18G0298100 [Arachis hypogaea]